MDYAIKIIAVIGFSLIYLGFLGISFNNWIKADLKKVKYHLYSTVLIMLGITSFVIDICCIFLKTDFK